MKSKVFITGANGFIGSNLCKYFLERNFDVYGLVRKTSDLHFLNGYDIKLIYGDLKNPEKIAIPRDIDYLFHSASIVTDTADDHKCYTDVYQLTVNLVQRILQLNCRIKKFIYVSTALTLGFDGVNISEAKPGKFSPFLPYIKYKKKSETYLINHYKKHNFPIIILRPSDVYGPNDRTSCANLLRGISKNIPIIAGHGNWSFGYCFIENLCQVAYLCCQKKGIEGNAYTVTNKNLPTWREFFSRLQKAIGKKQLIYVPVSFAYAVAFIYEAISSIFPGFDPPVTIYRIKRITTHTTYDISKTLEELGYQPDNNIAKQVEIIVSWYLEDKKKGFLT